MITADMRRLVFLLFKLNIILCLPELTDAPTHTLSVSRCNTQEL